MSHFYGTVRGNRGEASRGGSKDSGMTTHCASWKGAIRCQAYVNEQGQDCVRISKEFWRGRGENKVIYDGLIGEELKK